MNMMISTTIEGTMRRLVSPLESTFERVAVGRGNVLEADEETNARRHQGSEQRGQCAEAQEMLPVDLRVIAEKLAAHEILQSPRATSLLICARIGVTS